MRIRGPYAIATIVGTGLLLIMTVSLAMSADAPTFQDLEESLTCQCGCGLTVHSCNHLGCDSALPLRAEIREQMNLGKDKPAILAHFVDKYGEKILSSPTTSGFNLTAWVTPFALISLGGVFVLMTLMSWRRRGGARAPVGTTAESPAHATDHEKILERELKDFDR